MNHHPVHPPLPVPNLEDKKPSRGEENANVQADSNVGEGDMGHPVLRMVYDQAETSPEHSGGGAGADGLASLRDEDLMALSIDGQRAAFQELVERYQDRAFHTARGVVGNSETAREVAQEAFLKVYASRDRFDLKRRFSSWFYRILRNLAVDRIRRQSAGTPGAASSMEGDWNDGSRGPVAVASVEERRAAVHRILADLPAKFREVLALRDIEGMSCAEIAERVDLTTGTVRWRLHHARKLFRASWERRLGKEVGGSEL